MSDVGVGAAKGLKKPLQRAQLWDNFGTFAVPNCFEST